MKCCASKNMNLLESSLLGLFVVDVKEVLQASILGCRTDFLAEVRVGNSH